MYIKREQKKKPPNKQQTKSKTKPQTPLKCLINFVENSDGMYSKIRFTFYSHVRILRRWGYIKAVKL